VSDEQPGPAGAARSGAPASDDALVSRLRLIEDQALATRAEAYALVHDELRDALDAADRQGVAGQSTAGDRPAGR